ncbi:MAG: ribosome maturation factor RimM [Alphaproteobacteria bacterium]
MTRDTARDKVCLGAIAGAQGVRGQVRVKSFTARPEDVAAYGPLTDRAGRRFTLHATGMTRGLVVAKVDGVTDRNAAEALRGTELFVDRGRLPAPEEDEFYHADLIGLTAAAPDGTVLGTVRAVHDFGAGDMLDLALAEGGTAVVPFTRACVPEIDLAAGRLTVCMPDTVDARPAKDEEAGS